MSTFLRKRRIVIPLIGLIAGFTLVLFWPAQIPSLPTSVIIEDKHGDLISARVAQDGQWRFPKPDSIPHKVSTCIRLYEDEFFYQHPGINPVSIVRASRDNLRAGKVVSGASTITMQIARMARGNKRSFWNKLDEALFALKLELLKSKKALMLEYASMAPFGGNVVGLEAASWRYFGQAPHLLSWAQASTLAVLPNNPGAIFPGSKDRILQSKRDKLLKKLNHKGIIDRTTLELALLEPLPEKPLPLPNRAPHLLATYAKEPQASRTQVSIDPFWQERVNSLSEAHHLSMAANGVDNLAVLVVDLASGNVLAYKGNTTDQSADGWEVDIIQSRRSPGSSLKPFLYAASVHHGIIQKRTMLDDIPSMFGGFSPKNFNHGYRGMVPANTALSRSLNIPFAHLLDDYGYEQFHVDLKKWGITTLDKSAGHYGLTMILGGCEVKPWDLTQCYFSLYRKMNNLPNMAIHFSGNSEHRKSMDLGSDAIWETFQTMTSLVRPEGEKDWRNFESSQLIAWKTGTSHGFRDAWAVGINGQVIVTVWVGNADGEGRPDLVGIKAAAPLLHQLIRLSDYDPNWLENSRPVMQNTTICATTGLLASEHCPARTRSITKHGERIGKCPYHKRLWVDASGKFQVNSDCYSLGEAQEKVHLILPPIHAHYYRKENPTYPEPPRMHPDCVENRQPLDIIYPNANARIFIPKELSGEKGQVILQATHQLPDETLYWHINERFYGQTRQEHNLSVFLNPGAHVLSIVDSEGNQKSVRFDIAGEKRNH